jgi:zinc transporter ZupT
MITIKNSIAIIIPAITLYLGFYIGDNFEMTDKYNITIQYLVAGMLFAILSLDFLPIIIEPKTTKKRIYTILGLILGASILISTRAISNIKIKSKSSELLYATFIDLFTDGLLIGISTNILTGMRKYILALALSVDNFFLGIILAKRMKSEHKEKNYLLKNSINLCITLVLGGFIGLYVTHNFSKTLLFYFIVAIGVSGLLWLSTDIIITEYKKSIMNPVFLYLGLIIIVLLEWIQTKR